MSTSMRLAHVVVVTPDLDRLRTFYENTLGLMLVAVDGSPNGAATRLGVFAFGTDVAMLAYEIPGCDPQPTTTLGDRGSIDHFVFHVDSEVEHDTVRDRLVAAGASDGTMCSVSRGPVIRVTFIDPDGRSLGVVRTNPDWVADPDVTVMSAELREQISN